MRIQIPFIILVIFFISVFLSFPLSTYALEKQAAQSAALNAPDLDYAHDSRVVVLGKFLESYNSPLAEHAETFVKMADQNRLDWRLLASIAGVESTFARNMPADSHNAWGWGIYGDNTLYFKSYDEAIETISKTLREKYMDTWNARDVDEIGTYYAASPTWASRVSYFMDKIHEFEVNNPSHALSISL